MLLDKEVLSRRLEARFPGEEEYVFRHALVLEAAYAMWTEVERERAHRAAGVWLERRGESDAMLLAAHFERGREPRRAVTWYRRAAEQALEGNDFAAAITRASWVWPAGRRARPPRGCTSRPRRRTSGAGTTRRPGARRTW